MNNHIKRNCWVWSLAVLLFMSYTNLLIADVAPAAAAPDAAAAESAETNSLTGTCGSGSGSSSSESKSLSSSFGVRLHLIRHGETEANAKDLVLGQTDSPLTQRGIHQAKLANRAIGSYPFWRRYSSDLKRCETTASFILGLDLLDRNDDISANDANVNEDEDEVKDVIKYGEKELILDARLRERAKGVREGRPKHLTHDEAFEIFRLEREEAQAGDASNSNSHDPAYETVIKQGSDKINIDNDEMPLLETEEEVFIRVQDWVKEIFKDAYDDYLTTICSDKTKKLDNGRYSYDVFAVTHSGTLRIIIEKIVGKQLQLPHNVQREELDKDGMPVGRLIVPNTSITTIEIFLGNDDNDDSNNMDGQVTSMDINLGSDRNEQTFLRAKLIDLTKTLHLEEIENEIDQEL